LEDHKFLSHKKAKAIDPNNGPGPCKRNFHKRAPKTNLSAAGHVLTRRERRMPRRKEENLVLDILASPRAKQQF